MVGVLRHNLLRVKVSKAISACTAPPRTCGQRYYLRQLTSSSFRTSTHDSAPNTSQGVTQSIVTTATTTCAVQCLSEFSHTTQHLHSSPPVYKERFQIGALGTPAHCTTCSSYTAIRVGSPLGMHLPPQLLRVTTRIHSNCAYSRDPYCIPQMSPI